MKTNYLSEFNAFSKKGIAFIPLGTIEWHGNHLPIETDFLIAGRISEILVKMTGGYLLPPIYLGTDKERKVGNKKMIGMNSKLKKELAGNLYYLKPNLLFEVIKGLVDNLTKQKFNKIFIIPGHTGGKQIEVLKKVESKFKNVVLFNPYEGLKIYAGHADEYETSLFWACFPEEEKKSRKIKLGKNDDFVKYRGYDARQKASLEIGKKMLREIVANFKKYLK